MIPDFGSFTRMGLLVDLERPVEIWGGHILDRAVGAKLERRWEKAERPPTCLR